MTLCSYSDMIGTERSSQSWLEGKEINGQGVPAEWEGQDLPHVEWAKASSSLIATRRRVSSIGDKFQQLVQSSIAHNLLECG